MSNWQRVFSSRVQYKAEMVRAILEESELNPVVINKQDSAYKFGFFEVYVSPDETLRAIKIIKDEIQLE